MPPPSKLQPHRDDAADLETQIGCVTGLFHLFDPHPRKRISGPPSRLDSVSSRDISRGRHSQANYPTAIEGNDRPRPVAESGSLSSKVQAAETRVEVALLKQAHAPKEGAQRIVHVPGEQEAAAVSGEKGKEGTGSPPWIKGGSELWKGERGIEEAGAAYNHTTAGKMGSRGDWMMSREEAERRWAEEDAMEDWKQSLRALARMQEVAGRSGRGGYEAPMVSPTLRTGPTTNGGGPKAMVRSSSFEYKEGAAQRWSGGAMEPSRRSWDGHLPMESRFDAAQTRLLHLHPSNNLSPARRPAPSANVVARLMGLDDLPGPPSPALSSQSSLPSSIPPSPPPRTHRRSSSTEARLLQQLLQYTPPPSPLPSSDRRDLPSPPATPSSDPALLSPPSEYLETGHLRTELRTVLTRLENLSHPASDHKRRLHRPASHATLRTSSASPPLSPTSSVESGKTRSSSSPVFRKFINEGIPVVVLKQCEEASQSRANHAFQDEIEKRLRLLGLQSSEQERKTLKQILDAMQLKGLLRPPVSPQTLRVDDSNVRHPYVGSMSPSTRSSSSSGRSAKSSAQVQHPRSDGAATSIVIMKPLGKNDKVVESLVRTEEVNTTLKAKRASNRSPRKGKGDSQTTDVQSSLKGTSGRRVRSHSTATPADTRKLTVRVKAGRPLHDGKSKLSSSTVSSALQASPLPVDVADSRNKEDPLASSSCSTRMHADLQDSSDEETSKLAMSPAFHEDDRAFVSPVHSPQVNHVFASPDYSEASNNDTSSAVTLPSVYEGQQQYQLAEGTPHQSVIPAAMSVLKEELLQEAGEQGSPVSVLEPADSGGMSDNEHDSAKSILEGALVRASDASSTTCSADGDIVAEDEVTSGRTHEKSTESNAIEGEEATAVLRRRWSGGLSEKEFLYTEQVLMGAGLTADADVGAAAMKWLVGGCRISPNVYEELEERWEAAHDDEEEAAAGDHRHRPLHCDEDARDLGGELYRKSRQAAMRRRLLFDCLDDLVRERLLECIEMPEASSLRRFTTSLCVHEIWVDLRRLEALFPVRAPAGPSPHEDSLYSMLSQDLHDNHHHFSWSRWETQLGALARDLENAILDCLIEEFCLSLPWELPVGS